MGAYIGKLRKKKKVPRFDLEGTPYAKYEAYLLRAHDPVPGPPEPSALEHGLMHPPNAAVFISCCSTERERIFQLRDKLNKAGYTCWIDPERLETGLLSSPDVDRAVNVSNAVVICVSDMTTKSPHFKNLFRHACASGQPVWTLWCNDPSEMKFTDPSVEDMVRHHPVILTLDGYKDPVISADSFTRLVNSLQTPVPDVSFPAISRNPNGQEQVGSLRFKRIDPRLPSSVVSSESGHANVEISSTDSFDGPSLTSDVSSTDQTRSTTLSDSSDNVIPELPRPKSAPLSLLLASTTPSSSVLSRSKSAPLATGQSLVTKPPPSSHTPFSSSSPPLHPPLPKSNSIFSKGSSDSSSSALSPPPQHHLPLSAPSLSSSSPSSLPIDQSRLEFLAPLDLASLRSSVWHADALGASGKKSTNNSSLTTMDTSDNESTRSSNIRASLITPRRPVRHVSFAESTQTKLIAEFSRPRTQSDLPSRALVRSSLSSTPLVPILRSSLRPINETSHSDDSSLQSSDPPVITRPSSAPSPAAESSPSPTIIQSSSTSPSPLSDTENSGAPSSLTPSLNKDSAAVPQGAPARNNLSRTVTTREQQRVPPISLLLSTATTAKEDPLPPSSTSTLPPPNQTPGIESNGNIARLSLSSGVPPPSRSNTPRNANDLHRNALLSSSSSTPLKNTVPTLALSHVNNAPTPVLHPNTGLAIPPSSSLSANSVASPRSLRDSNLKQDVPRMTPRSISLRSNVRHDRSYPSTPRLSSSLSLADPSSSSSPSSTTMHPSTSSHGDRSRNATPRAMLPALGDRSLNISHSEIHNHTTPSSSSSSASVASHHPPLLLPSTPPSPPQPTIERTNSGFLPGQSRAHNPVIEEHLKESPLLSHWDPTATGNSVRKSMSLSLPNMGSTDKEGPDSGLISPRTGLRRAPPPGYTPRGTHPSPYASVGSATPLGTPGSPPVTSPSSTNPSYPLSSLITRTHPSHNPQVLLSPRSASLRGMPPPGYTPRGTHRSDSSSDFPSPSTQTNLSLAGHFKHHQLLPSGPPILKQNKNVSGVFSEDHHSLEVASSSDSSSIREDTSPTKRLPKVNNNNFNNVGASHENLNLNLNSDVTPVRSRSTSRRQQHQLIVPLREDEVLLPLDSAQKLFLETSEASVGGDGTSFVVSSQDFQNTTLHNSDTTKSITKDSYLATANAIATVTIDDENTDSAPAPLSAFAKKKKSSSSGTKKKNSGPTKQGVVFMVGNSVPDD